jgi:hypothetical protein
VPLGKRAVAGEELAHAGRFGRSGHGACSIVTGLKELARTGATYTPCDSEESVTAGRGASFRTP